MTRDQLNKIAKALEAESMALHNYGGDDSVLKFDSQMDFDSQFNEYGHAYTGAEKVVASGQTTFDFTITHDNAAAVSVPIRLFASIWNNGVFVGDNLTFTVGGATVTIAGTTAGWRQLQTKAVTAPFRINFIRVLPTTALQLANPFTFVRNNVFGSSNTNNLTPNTYIDPNQYQLLRVDVPTNYVVDADYEIDWTIRPAEVIQATLFIDQILDPTKSLKGQTPIRNLGVGGITAQPYSAAAYSLIRKSLQSSPAMARLNTAAPMQMV